MIISVQKSVHPSIDPTSSRGLRGPSGALEGLRSQRDLRGSRKDLQSKTASKRPKGVPNNKKDGRTDRLIRIILHVL